MTDHWSSRYVGLPWIDHGRSMEGCDCYGLVRVVFREELGISLPDYLGYASAGEQGEVAALIEGAKTLPMWVPVEGPALAFDVAVFRRGRIASHVGLIVRSGMMLHMSQEDCAKIEPIGASRWQHRLTGCWRHVDVISQVRR